MKPGVARWSTNVNYAGGTGIGQPTKMPPSPGQEEDGIEPDSKVDAQIWNYKRWESDLKISQLEAMWVKNWFLATLPAGVNPGTDKGAFFDTYQNIHTVTDFSGAASHSEVLSANSGRFLALAVIATPNAAGNPGDGFATGTDTRVTTHPNAADNLWYSTAMGAWTLWFGLGATGKSFAKGDFYNGRYCFLDILVDIFSTTGTGVVPGVVDVQLAGTYCSLRHSKHVAGTLHPNDSGNLIWLAVTSTHASTSSDGVSWGVPVAHGLAGVDSESWLAYSAYGSRWIIATKGVVGGLGTIGISDDNGATWTSHDVLPYYRVTGPTGVKIASDGFGTWVVAAAEVGTNEIDTVYSIDNGDTWDVVHLPSEEKQSSRVALWYGDGQFNIAFDDNTSGDYHQYHSLTIER